MRLTLIIFAWLQLWTAPLCLAGTNPPPADLQALNSSQHNLPCPTATTPGAIMLHKKSAILLLAMALLLGLLSINGFAAEIGFVEDFALAKERQTALDKLIPGTEDYYYYHALHFMNQGDYQTSNQYLQKWRSRYDYPNSITELENR